MSDIQNSLLDLLGVGEKDKEFIFSTYLPVLEENIGHIELSLVEKAELSENTLGTVIKLLYAFVWQEGVIKFPSGKYSPSDISLYILHGTISYLQCTNKSLYFEGWNLTPEANAAGAAFTPKLNAFGNNLTLWDLTVQDVQVGRERHVYTRVATCPVQAGGGYPGSGGCNDVIPHAKWHAQTAASLADMTRLMDFVLMLERRHTAHAQ